MLAAPSRDWNIFKQIFADHWDGFTHAHPRYQTAYSNDLVSKMLACGNPDKMGYSAYRCQHCGQGKHLVAMLAAVCAIPHLVRIAPRQHLAHQTIRVGCLKER